MTVLIRTNPRQSAAERFAFWRKVIGLNQQHTAASTGTPRHAMAANPSRGGLAR